MYDDFMNCGALCKFESRNYMNIQYLFIFVV